jgi:hypothetical protein
MEFNNNGIQHTMQICFKIRDPKVSDAVTNIFVALITHRVQIEPQVSKLTKEESIKQLSSESGTNAKNILCIAISDQYAQSEIDYPFHFNSIVKPVFAHNNPAIPSLKLHFTIRICLLNKYREEGVVPQQNIDIKKCNDNNDLIIYVPDYAEWKISVTHPNNANIQKDLMIIVQNILTNFKNQNTSYDLNSFSQAFSELWINYFRKILC